MSTIVTLRCEGLSKSFDGTQALIGVTIQLVAPQVVAVVGPNGAGKTTLARAITGWIEPDGGRVLLGDKEITKLGPARIARLGIGRTFQELRFLHHVSVLDNVMLAHPNQQGERLFYALTRIGTAKQEATNRAASMELLRVVGLSGRASEPAGELSYGQQKLLTLVCCVATGANILLLDEPVAGVHPEMAEHVLNLILKLKAEGKLVVFIEHDLAAVRKIADRVIVMDDGRVIANGFPNEVLSRPDVLEAFVG